MAGSIPAMAVDSDGYLTIRAARMSLRAPSLRCWRATRAHLGSFEVPRSVSSSARYPQRGRQAAQAHVHATPAYDLIVSLRALYNPRTHNGKEHAYYAFSFPALAACTP